LRRIGIQPDIIVARCEKPLDPEARSKIALFSNVPPEAVVSNHDVTNIYEVPIVLMNQMVHRILANRLALDYREPDLSPWLNFLEKASKNAKMVKIAMIGKYTKLKDSYISITEAIKHASAYVGVKPTLRWLESTDIENGYIDIEKELTDINGALILPGFGKRGTEGKVRAIKYLREHNIPTLGICFGFQLMVIEIARNVIGLSDANSSELDPSTPHPVIDLLPSQKGIDTIGGTMRLGAISIKLYKGRKVYEAYGKEIISERHRHRYGVNMKYIDKLESAGFVVSGVSLDNESIVEFMELNSHILFIGTQSHPEFKSKPLAPSPLYLSFISEISAN
jgi:CTP synthase